MDTQKKRSTFDVDVRERPLFKADIKGSLFDLKEAAAARIQIEEDEADWVAVADILDGKFNQAQLERFLRLVQPQKEDILKDIEINRIRRDVYQKAYANSATIDDLQSYVNGKVKEAVDNLQLTPQNVSVGKAYDCYVLHLSKSPMITDIGSEPLGQVVARSTQTGYNSLKDMVTGVGRATKNAYSKITGGIRGAYRKRKAKRSAVVELGAQDVSLLEKQVRKVVRGGPGNFEYDWFKTDAQMQEQYAEDFAVEKGLEEDLKCPVKRMRDLTRAQYIEAKQVAIEEELRMPLFSRFRLKNYQ